MSVVVVVVVGASSPTASAIVAQAVSGSHVLTIDGYSRTKGLGTGKFIKSATFYVGGHRWFMRYFPDGYTSADWISIHLLLDHREANEVKARFKIGLIDQHGEIVTPFTQGSQQTRIFRVTEDSLGSATAYISRNDLERSMYLKDDVFRVRCDITVPKEIITELTTPAIRMPPSDMHHHLAWLLSTGEGSDVTFEVGGETFPAHRYMLAARSSVFRAELLGPMKEKTATRLRIDDMEAKVFRALLHFIYTDSLPEIDEGGTAVMAQHLLVAATTLALADQHGCGALKKACIKFLISPGNLKAVMASDGFQHLTSSCPWVLEELVAKLAP